MIGERAVAAARILVADDQQAIVTLLERLLEVAGFREVNATTDSSRVVELCAALEPDLLLLTSTCPSRTGSRCSPSSLRGRTLPYVCQ